jgi:acetate kinase
MAWCGLVLDPARNAAAIGTETGIAAPGSAVRAFVIPTDEERVIARDAATRLARTAGTRA